MNTGIVLLNFGEPPEPDRDIVVEYLTNIFYNNADLEDAATDEEARERSRELARRRAPGLIEEYEEIGGSPLNEQSRAQATLLEETLEERGHDVETYVGMQFLEPYIDDAVSQAAADGIDHLIGLPIYPLCGPSTTVAALEELRESVDARDDWDVEVDEITGWHRHPTYNRLRADAIATFVDEQGLELTEDGTTLVFSAHGTPQHYLEEGSRYVIYVEEYCETIASLVGVDDYELGYQNHENRDIPWTEPDVETLIEDLETDRVVVDPVSFMHEQSETLSELDDDLREEATDVGLEFHRVPIPHDDPRFGAVLADLLEPFVADFGPDYYGFRQCQCRDEPGTMCLNAPLRPVGEPSGDR
ncbi:ferrochelatase [Natrialbaceae archaeon AArc-T1-2]|uniref:ferrochelatase n=1 Tax=Natrialbaceae archaeon AArc-T1-2 TaxID=3053904 RepID=UPI00255ABF25|nr:ferrochelatase [Natrialbaceae archaeon AArc-T1-2]WIV67869.1 ferrochelatase [Natrialbaceae archaeon AArc-T1-2]